VGQLPLAAGLALLAGHPLGLPVNRELARVKALAGKGRANSGQRSPARSSRSHGQAGGFPAGLHRRSRDRRNARLRSRCRLSHRRSNVGGHLLVLGSGRRRLDMDQQMRKHLITGFGHMHGCHPSRPCCVCYSGALGDRRARKSEWRPEEGCRRRAGGRGQNERRTAAPTPAAAPRPLGFRPTGKAARLPLIADSRRQPSAPICSAIACRFVASLGSWSSSMRQTFRSGHFTGTWLRDQSGATT